MKDAVAVSEVECAVRSVGVEIAKPRAIGRESAIGGVNRLARDIPQPTNLSSGGTPGLCGVVVPVPHPKSKVRRLVCLKLCRSSRQQRNSITERNTP